MRLKRLDGIRTIAVLPVIFLHHFIGERTGWVGVDIFFVLSGFLITGILLRSGDHNYWSSFYLKRATRILPPLAALFVMALLFSHHLSWVGLFGYSLFLGNLVNVTHYALAPFIVLWSLAIEEHFYLIWPILTRYIEVRGLIKISLLLIIIEPLARIGATLLGSPPMWTYYLTPFRLDGLACGALLALMEATGNGTSLLRRYGGSISATAWALLILLTLCVPSFTRDSGSLLFNGVGYSLAALASFAGIGYIAWSAECAAARLLSLPFMAWIGRISYGMYLYHTFVLATTRHLFHIPAGTPGIEGTKLLLIVDLPLTVLISWISFQFLESPILGWAQRQTRPKESETAPKIA